MIFCFLFSIRQAWLFIYLHIHTLSFFFLIPFLVIVFLSLDEGMLSAEDYPVSRLKLVYCKAVEQRFGICWLS